MSFFVKQHQLILLSSIAQEKRVDLKFKHFMPCPEKLSIVIVAGSEDTLDGAAAKQARPHSPCSCTFVCIFINSIVGRGAAAVVNVVAVFVMLSVFDLYKI